MATLHNSAPQFEPERHHNLTNTLSMASVEEKEISKETAAALDRARASLASGKSFAHEEISTLLNC